MKRAHARIAAWRTPRAIAVLALFAMAIWPAFPQAWGTRSAAQEKKPAPLDPSKPIVVYSGPRIAVPDLRIGAELAQNWIPLPPEKYGEWIAAAESRLAALEKQNAALEKRVAELEKISVREGTPRFTVPTPQ